MRCETNKQCFVRAVALFAPTRLVVYDGLGFPMFFDRANAYGVKEYVFATLLVGTE